MSRSYREDARPENEGRPPALPVRRLASPRIGWGTRVAFAMLATIAVIVFFLLPRWVEEPETPPGTSASRERASEPTRDHAEASGETRDESREESPGTDREPASSSSGGRAHIEDREAGDARASNRRTEAAAEARRERESERAFTEALSEGLRELEAENPELAGAAFERARGMRPSSREALDGLARANAELRLRAIARHRDEAREHEGNEEWSRAVASYEAALAIDPTIRFAIDGSRRSAERAELDATLAFHVAHPDRLSDAGVLAEAARALEAAARIEAPGRRHRERMARLDALVKDFSKTVPVELRSDNLTEVTMYKVGRLGRFEHREMSLRPGTYVVVGSRPGYRDVRRQLVVATGGGRPSLTILCEDAI